MDLLLLVCLFFVCTASSTSTSEAFKRGLEQSAITCDAPSPIVSSSADLRAKIRAPPGTCSTLKGFRVLAGNAANDDDYSCSESKPCANGACCAKTGWCNYSPEACGTDGKSPNDKCWSNCNAHAECGKDAITAGTICPLNVCCSKFGSCGTTEDFCGNGCQSGCDQPESGGLGGDVQSRIIGYYEVWNHDVKCIKMSVQDIPVESITHLHFAFTYLSPGSFRVVPMEGISPERFNEVASLKKQNPALKVLISLGGWTFNNVSGALNLDGNVVANFF